MRHGVLGALFLLAFGCGPSDDPPDGGAGLDGSSRCTADVECSDGVFCNGIERCRDAVCESGPSPCVEGTACDEAAGQCLLGCATDADGDGVPSMECGGADCDDDDPARFPGATEVCDVEGVDEDCDPTTFGARDADEDGAVDASCCNVVPGGGTLCGRDCDDGQPGANPTAPEVCDDIDNDCDGAVDEGVSYDLWPDADRDAFGDALTAPERRCGFFPGFALIGGDCDDGDESRNPGTHDVCNGVDDDCDGTIDEGADARCAAAGAAEAFCASLGGAAPRCVVSRCEGTRLDCNGDPTDGCEANYCDELAHCGACGGYGGACSGGRCSGGRCAPRPLALFLVNGEVTRDSDGAPIAGATVGRLRACGSPATAMTNASGAFSLSWSFDYPFVQLLTEAPGYASRVDAETSWESVSLLTDAELDALLALSPTPVDRRLGIVIVDSRGGSQLVEPVSGLYRAPSVPADPAYQVPLRDGWTRNVHVNVRPGRLRVRMPGAGDTAQQVTCNDVGPTYAGTWDAPTYHDTVASSAGVIHVRFNWCQAFATGG